MPPGSVRSRGSSDGVTGGFVPHVELSLTDFGHLSAALRSEPRDPFACWAAAVANAVEPSLVIDSHETIIAMSPSCVAILGLREAPIGQPLRSGALRLIDFSSPADSLDDIEVGKIPPLLSLTSGRLARGLIRVDCDGSVCTLDAVATPIGAQGEVVGSLTFFSPV
jgi:hypothetical protein